MASVFVLYHADIEDDRYVRGIYATAALAEAALRWDEVDGYRRSHHEYCCSVDEMVIQTDLPDVAYGPDARYAADDRPGLLRPDLVALLEAAYLQPTPGWDALLKRDG